VDGDEDLLHRAVFNLTLNAVQATSAGGTVLVTVGPAPTSLPASLRHPGGTVRIVVADNGPGISAEVRSRLFDPFTTTKPGGSGLGLSIVQRAIEAHRGAVLVDSGVTGTRFTIYLPLRQQPQEKVA
jgi:two-component system sensor histidine kinase PilS (NtrC family)